MASRCTQSRTWRSCQAQKATKRPPGPGGQRAPAPQDEDPRVKCRDCGAFGHKASSVRCPMKRWQGALAPQPLGCRLGKENLEPRKLQVLQTLRTCNLAERDKEQRPRQAGHQLKLLQRLPGRPQGQQWCWKEVTESCDYVRVWQCVLWGSGGDDASSVLILTGQCSSSHPRGNPSWNWSSQVGHLSGKMTRTPPSLWWLSAGKVCCSTPAAASRLQARDLPRAPSSLVCTPKRNLDSALQEPPGRTC